MVSICCMMAVSFSSCEKDEPECFESNLILSRVSFIGKNLMRMDTLIDSVFVDTTITVYRDTLFKSPILYSFNQDVNVQVIGSPYLNYMGLPLNPDEKSIRYALVYDTTRSLADTLTYFYQTSVHFISNDCGFTHFYRIDSIQTTKHLIDSVTINERKVGDNAADRHIHLYYFN